MLQENTWRISQIQCKTKQHKKKVITFKDLKKLSKYFMMLVVRSREEQIVTEGSW